MREYTQPKGQIDKSYTSADPPIWSWQDLEGFYQELLDRSLPDLTALEELVADKSRLDAVVSEKFSRSYIKITVDSDDKEALQGFHHMVQEISPQVARYEYLINRKLVASPFLDELDPEAYYIFLRQVRNSVALYREENVPLQTEVQLRSKEYGRIFSQMTIGVDGKQMTLQKAGTFLEETDRERREAVFRKINDRILQDTDSLEELFDVLLQMRHRIACNAGFRDFRDYAFRALGRFDYAIEDCLDFHCSIANEVLPIIDHLNQLRREALRVEELRPWDLHVDTSLEPPLRPFRSVEELVDKAILCLNRLRPEFGDTISVMRELGQLDLESRKGKRPGGYNMPLLKTGVPFIFMNATGSFNDLRTLLHESGHAIHAYLTRDLEITAVRRFPSEVAELAAMSMELLTMEHWDIFFDNPGDLRRAKISQLENVLKVLPWIATIDKFQHWAYTHPGHSRKDRQTAWLSILEEFSSNGVNNEGMERYHEHLWHKQLHIFEVPFYYIEYGMAQLGAIAIWQNYCEDPEKATDQYVEMLRLGYTRPIGEVYAAAGISFDFSRAYIAQLGQFVMSKLEALMQESATD